MECLWDVLVSVPFLKGLSREEVGFDKAPIVKVYYIK